MRKLFPALLALFFIGATIVPDQYDVLFTKCNGTTTTFVDISTANPKTITANGNSTQLSMPAGVSNTAMFFNGTTDYVVVPASADFNFDANFKVETLVFFDATPATTAIMGNGYTTGWEIQYQDLNYLRFLADGALRATFAWTPAARTWYKISVERVGTTITISVNNTPLGTATYGSAISSTNPLYIGRDVVDDSMLKGWLKNLTIVKGATTVLDMRGNTSATSPLGPAISFDGTTDFLGLANSTDWNLGTAGNGDLTVEGKFKFLSISNDAGLVNGFSSGSSGWQLAWSTTNKLFVYFNGAGANSFSSSFTPIVGNWYHIAFTRSGSTVTFWINGQSYGTVADGDMTSGGTGLAIGCENQSGITAFNGYIRELRITKGLCRYTTAFTPSDSGFTADANTVLYIKGNEDNGSTTFLDSSISPKTVTTNGDTKIKYTEDYRSCIFKDETGKFPYPVGSAKVDFFSIGTGCYYGDGTGDSISVPDSPDLDLPGDYTVDTYARPGVNNATQWLFGRESSGGNGFNLGFTSTQFRHYLAGSAYDYAFVPALNTWWHFAVSRNGSSVNFFINGTLVHTETDSTAVSYSTRLDVGAISIGGTMYESFTGRIDNARFAKGVARYTATFNPPADFAQTGSSGRRKTNWFWFF